MGRDKVQDKNKEISFFTDWISKKTEYTAFTQESYRKIISASLRMGRFQSGHTMADVGCGTGAFTRYWVEAGIHCSGVDLCPSMIAAAQALNPPISFQVGDVENLPFESNSLDGIFLGGVLHHLPNLEKAAGEIFRVLKPSACFVAFDPNLMNPLMALYRHPRSPLYSRVGVTENERPITALQVRAPFSKAGFKVSQDYLGGLEFSFVGSPLANLMLPLYHALDRMLWTLLPQSFGGFLLSLGQKSTNPKHGTPLSNRSC